MSQHQTKNSVEMIVNKRMYTHIHKQTHTSTYLEIHMHMYKQTCALKHIQARTTHMQVRACTHIHTHTKTNIHAWLAQTHMYKHTRACLIHSIKAIPLFY